MTIQIGPVSLRSRVILAPMSGVTDAPFRALVDDLGVGLVVSEMIASQEMIQRRLIAQRKVDGVDRHDAMSVQIAGREAHWMAEAARIAEGEGAAIVDINMGCPAKQVTNGYSGSALMRNLDHALTLIEATVEAVSVPVTLKMRTGWNDETRNAPELARRAEQAGVQLVTVHGRTRQQFYKGKADWDFIRNVKQEVSIPVIANGDLVQCSDAETMLERSGADGVMIGRGAYGRPWFPGQVEAYLETGKAPADPEGSEKLEIILRHYTDILEHYGPERGVRVARKHLCWYLEPHEGSDATRQKVCRAENPSDVIGAMTEFFLSEPGPALRKAA